MKDFNFPPFYLGQTVLALKSASNGYGSIIKDNTYTVKGMEQCKCGKWRIYLGLSNGVTGNQFCTTCKHYSGEVSDRVYVDSSLLAPITSTFHPISLERVIEIETSLVSEN